MARENTGRRNMRQAEHHESVILNEVNDLRRPRARGELVRRPRPGRVALAFVLTLTILTPACSDEDALLARVVEQGDSGRREIALTFDAGTGGSTDPEGAAEILRVLREHNVRATFSLTGLWAETNRDLLFTIAADGHQIINGTYAGQPWAGLSANERKLALTRTEVTVYRYTSRSTIPYIRPPGGEVDESVRRDAAANGYDTIVLWSLDCDEFPLNRIACFRVTGDRFVRGEDLLDAAEPGAIIALGITDREAAAVAAIVSGLQDGEYSLVTVDALLAP